jgi:hypothetical protein
MHHEANDLRNQRKEIKALAKIHLIGKWVMHPGIPRPIFFTSTGIKEAINQPHKHIYEKNNSIKEIIDIIRTARYIKTEMDSYGKGNNQYHYLRTEICGEDSFVVLKESKHDERIFFYSIVDKIKE